MTLSEFFEKNPKCALGYSGGVDSAFLLYSAVMNNIDIKPYFVKSAFTTKKECDEAISFASSLGCEVKVIDIDLVSVQNIRANTQDRCYFCKSHIFNAIKNSALADGYDVLLEGTNASDDIADRPGFKAITELGVISPLKLCGISKDEIRDGLKTAGFDIWNKPATACLATRIPCGVEITVNDLEKVSQCENILYEMGFSDLRVRIFNGAARIQLKSEMIRRAADMHNEIQIKFKPYFDDVFLDLKGR